MAGDRASAAAIDVTISRDGRPPSGQLTAPGLQVCAAAPTDFATSSRVMIEKPLV